MQNNKNYRMEPADFRGIAGNISYIMMVLRNLFILPRKKPIFPAVAVLICLMPALLLSCTPSESDYLAYQRGAHEFTVRGIAGDLAFCAEITLGEQPDRSVQPDAPAPAGREISISFTEPETLRGITLERHGGAVYFSSGSMKIPTSPETVSGILEIAGLFEIDGSLDRVEKIQPGAAGETRNRLHISTPQGNYRVLIDIESALPLQIEGDINGRVIFIDIVG